MRIHRLSGLLMLSTVILAGRDLAFCGSHLWKVNELFSSPDGRIQFIELHECCGAEGEVFLQNIEVTSRATGSVFTFPEYLEESTARKYLLLATEGFAALDGAPTPDYIIEDGFLGLDGDTIWYGEARNYDRFVYASGDLPTDGRSSIHVTDYESDEFTVEENSPTNFAGETGSVDARELFRRADCNVDGGRDIADAIYLLNALFLAPEPIDCSDACDANDDGDLNISDASAILQWLFLPSDPLPPPGEPCGLDPSVDEINCSRFDECG